MSVGVAWTTLGFDPQAVLTRLARIPRPNRVEAARQELEFARRAAKRLLAEYHPDRGGDIEKFKEVGNALRALEEHTESFAKRMDELTKAEDEKRSKRPFIKFGQ